MIDTLVPRYIRTASLYLRGKKGFESGYTDFCVEQTLSKKWNLAWVSLPVSYISPAVLGTVLGTAVLIDSFASCAIRWSRVIEIRMM